MKRFLVVVLSIECAIAGWLVADRLLTVRPPGGRPEFFFNSSDSLRDVLPAEWDRVVASVATEDTPEAWLELISFPSGSPYSLTTDTRNEGWHGRVRRRRIARGATPSHAVLLCRALPPHMCQPSASSRPVRRQTR